ncbi:MAG: OmpA family protein, partial [Thiomargarita sp.]|nr:OmpA family protein [Thiomargarita sp.]
KPTIFQRNGAASLLPTLPLNFDKRFRTVFKKKTGILALCRVQYESHLILQENKNMFIIRLLLFCYLLITMLPVVAVCPDYTSQINQAIRANNLTQLEQLLPILHKDSCPDSYINAIKRSIADIAAAQADSLVQEGKISAAEKWLEHAETMTWGTQVVRGDIAVRRQDWQNASIFYNQTLDLINDPEATPQAPSEAQIEKIYQQATEAQILTASVNTISRTGQANGMMRGKIRGFIPRKRAVPVPFYTGKWGLDENGKRVTRQLASYIKNQGFSRVTLTGHTDENGPSLYNDFISKKRANAVKSYFETEEITAKIKAIGKGEDEPLELENGAYYNQEQIDMLNRRVELSEMK